MTTTPGRPSGRRTPGGPSIIGAGFVAYAAIGWFLSGLGAILPVVDDDVGRLAVVYPLLPGVAMVVLSTAALRRVSTPQPDHAAGGVLGTASLLLAAASITMGLTAVSAVSLAGAVAGGIAVAVLVRSLPGVLAGVRPADAANVIMRANAWSSLAAIVAPVAVGAAIAVSVGWRVGFGGPLIVAGVVTWYLARGSASRAGDVSTVVSASGAGPEAPAGASPPIGVWFRPWLVLTLAIVIEFCFAYFVATYLRDELGLSSATAAVCAAGWGIGMTVGRFAFGTRPNRFTRGIVASTALIGAGWALFWVTHLPVVAVAGIVAAGLGVAPQYPVLVSRLMAPFGAARARGSTFGSLASGTALTVAPGLMAALRAGVGLRYAYLAVPVLLVVLLVVARGTDAGQRADRRPAARRPAATPAAAASSGD